MTAVVFISGGLEVRMPTSGYASFPPSTASARFRRRIASRIASRASAAGDARVGAGDDKDASALLGPQQPFVDAHALRVPDQGVVSLDLVVVHQLGDARDLLPFFPVPLQMS